MTRTRARQAGLLFTSVALAFMSLVALAYLAWPLAVAFFACSVVCTETAWHLSDTVSQGREDARTISDLVAELEEGDAALALVKACCVPWFLTAGKQHAARCHPKES